MRFVCSPTPKSALPRATKSRDSSGTVGTRMDSSSPSSRKNPFSFAATIGRWSGFKNHSSATVTHCVLFLPIYPIRGRVIEMLGWRRMGPGRSAARLAWFMAGQPRRRCDLLRFAEHPRCAGRSAERELVTRCIERVTPHGRPDAARGVQPSLRGLDGETPSCDGLCGGRTRDRPFLDLPWIKGL